MHCFEYHVDSDSWKRANEQSAAPQEVPEGQKVFPSYHFWTPLEIVEKNQFSFFSILPGILIIAWVTEHFKYVLQWRNEKCLLICRTRYENILVFALIIYH